MEHVKKKQIEGGPRAKLAYYYFDFNDHAKQTSQGCIQSLVKKLFTQPVKTPEELRSLYNGSQHRTPSLNQLMEVLIAILGDGTQNFIIIDALDECKEEGEMEREALFYRKSSLVSKVDTISSLPVDPSQISSESSLSWELLR
jgi:hypothetical protein